MGIHHVAEVVLFLRREDIDWFNSNSNNNNTESSDSQNNDEQDTVVTQNATNNRQDELMELLSTSIIPRMCGDELEQFYQKKYPQRFPTDGVGEKNRPVAATLKRKRGGKKGGKSKAVDNNNEDNNNNPQKKIKDIYYAFGETLHVAYKTQDINTMYYEGATLLFSSNKTTTTTNQHKAGSGGFQQLTKLSKRFLLWCYRNKNEIEANEEKQMQPEMVPMDQLFRPESEAKPPPKKKRARRKKKA